MWIFFGLVWATFGAFGGMIANERGGDPLLGFIVGLLFGPLGLIAAFYLGDEVSREQKLIEAGDRKRCPTCSELVRPSAKLCRYCGHDFAALHLQVSDAA